MPAPTPDTVVLVPVPVVVAPPGVRVNVHVPTEGKPLNTTLPVATAHVGWVIVPTKGADGVAGCALITTSADAAEAHPTELVTVKLYVPAVSPETVVFVPLPDIAPGLIVQVPTDGKPFNKTLPVGRAHVGWVIVPETGAGGVAGCVLMTTLADDNEIHPAALVTV